MSRVGRPRKWKHGWRLTSFMIPTEYEGFIQEIERQSQAEGTSLSELILKMAMEAWQTHYPRNPQTILPSHTGEAPKPLRLEAKFAMKELSTLIECLEAKHGSTEYRRDIQNRIIQLIVKMARANQKLKNPEIDKQVDQAAELLEDSYKK